MKVSEQLGVAQDESTDQEVLRELWKKSRSILVRKAIAKNPNAGPQVLKAAARLYLEEVLENPGFHVLELFDDDEWIKNISQCYSNPDEFMIVNSSLLYRRRVGTEADQYYWACILSPNLTSFALNRILQYISITQLKRIIKNRHIVLKIKDLYQNSLVSNYEGWTFDLQSLLVMWNQGIIDDDLLYEGLSNYSFASTSCTKSTFKRSFEKICQKFKSSQRDETAKLLAKMFLVCRSHVLTWVKKNYLDSYNLLAWSGNLYTKVLHYFLNVPRSSSITKNHITMANDIVNLYIKERFLNADSVKPETLNSIYHFYTSSGLVDNSATRKLKATIFVPIKSIVESLKYCDISIKEFFVRNECLGTWTSISDNKKYSIINDVNNHIYSREGITKNLLFNCCSMNKIISIKNSVHIF